MRLLLDPHALLWFLGGRNALGLAARQAIEHRRNEVPVSAVSAYEIAFKCQLARLAGVDAKGPEADCRTAGFAVLPIDFAMGLASGMLPGPRRDPWDRFLMAHAVRDSLAVVTGDPIFAACGVPTLW